MPKTSLIKPFVEKYGNGPDKPSTRIKTADVIVEKRTGKEAEQGSAADADKLRR